MLWVLIGLMGMSACAQDAEVVGARPYEMDWAGRTQDDNPPLIDFEDVSGWTVETENAEARFERSREQQIWGKYVGKLTYRGTDGSPTVNLIPPEPIAIDRPFDAVTLWMYGNNWFGRDPSTPMVSVTAVFADAEGAEFRVQFQSVRWQEWFLLHLRLTPEQIKGVEGGGQFKRFTITNGRNKQDRFIYLDNLAVFEEAFKPLTFAPRPKRGIPMFPGQTVGTNTGPGQLPFPVRPETILPENLTDDFTTGLTRDGDVFVFTYKGADGQLTYSFAPASGTWSDISARWSGYAGEIDPCVDGGVRLVVDGKPVLPDKREHLSTTRQGDDVVSRWRVSSGDVAAEVTYTFRLWGKSLVIETVAPGGNVADVRYGYAGGLDQPRTVTNPYYTYGATRPAVAISGPADSPLFLSGNTDWYLSNASEPWAEDMVDQGRCHYNGGTRYTPRTDGVRNDCYERFFISISPRYEEVLPTIANPVSPWKHITGTKLWRAHGASNRDSDKAYWRKCHRYGMTQVVVTDHETMWRDGGESFTFRTKAAPGKGGDEGALDYSRFMQDELGFTYGPYNNFTDFAPVNEFWSTDLINRLPDNQLQHAWTRCYAPKPSRAVEYCAMIAPILDEKFDFSTAYCDVHTAVTPWSRVDYDPRVPGAGTFAATYYSYGEIMLLQKAAWGGPVYSEGNNHFSYCGMTDGNYGQDQNYKPATSPWLVDFDLRKMHDLCCNFGMGSTSMFYGRDASLGQSRKEIDASIDRFFAATIAFGHPGFLTFDGGYHHALRSYYMLQQLHSRYCLSSADEIRYADENGKLLDTSAAVASGAYRRSQVVTRYEDGTVTAVNGSLTDRMKVSAYGRELDLPPNGYAGWTADGTIEVSSADPEGHRCDYSVSPAHLFVDGRGKFTRFEKAAGNGIGICRTLEDGRHEVIPYEDAETGFAITATKAVAVNYEGEKIGPAELRISRGLTYVMPVEGAFSYILETGQAPGTALASERDEVVPGEKVQVTGKEQHIVEIPGDVTAGDRIWRQLEDSWIDFTVVPLADTTVNLVRNELEIALASNLPHAEEFSVTVGDETRTLTLQPGEPKQVSVDLGQPEYEMAGVLEIKLVAGDLSDTILKGTRVIKGAYSLVSLPEEWSTGMALRGQPETANFGQTRGRVSIAAYVCGDVRKAGFAMHPPYFGGVGYSFLLYDPVTVPEQPAAFRAFVGKGDGSDPGDGILYRATVVEDDGTETEIARRVVTEHEWAPIEGELSPWSGEQVRIKIIADVGEEDNSSGDWACWGEMRIEDLQPVLVREITDDAETYRLEDGPFPVENLTVEMLRGAKKGWLRYDGNGLSGTGEAYGSFAVVNGIELGNMAPAGGSETQGIWAENVGVPLTGEAIATLDFRNTFALRNPMKDYFKVRRFWIELELADGRKCSSQISAATFTQPPGWPYAEGTGVPHGENITTDIWFAR